METKDVDNIDDGHAADNEDNEPESPSGLPGETVDELRGTPKKHRRLSSLSKAGKLNSKLHLTPDLTFMPKKRRRSLIERAKSGPFTTYLPTASPLLSLARQKTKTDETQILKTENLVHARPSRISNVLAGDSKSAIRIPDPRFRTDSEISESDRKDTETEIDEKAITKSSRGPYVLSRHQRFTYTQIFKNLSERKQMWGSISKEKTLDIEYLRHALLDCGYYRTQSEMNRIKIKLGMEKFAKMNLDQFLMFMTRVSMAQISKSMREEYKSTYLKYAKDPGAGLTIEELGQMMTEMFRDAYIQDDIDNIINQWGNKHARTVNFQQFISMMAFSQMQNKLERQVERKAFRLFAGNQGRRRIYYRNIQTAIKNMTGVEIDDVTAKEMLWEADVNQKGFLDKHDFLQLVITVFKPGYVVLWNYKKNRAETVQLDALNEEEFEKLDGETKYWKDQIGISDEEDVMAESETEESGPEGTDIPETDTGGKPSDATECGEPPAGDQPRTSVVSI
uniref:Calmodulin n=1 Tax=Amorphochlora amoebiformis TaxID=1561963 RepID=A0A7S0DQJ7_9EUKA